MSTVRYAGAAVRYTLHRSVSGEQVGGISGLFLISASV